MAEKNQTKVRTILHVDVNNYFASVECSTRPELKEKPVAVTGNPEKRTGIILAKNEIAKSFGVKTGEAIWQAKQKCPDLVTLAPHYALYEKISKQLHKLYLTYTDLVEPLGLDECWLDITPSLNYLGKTGKEVADEIRAKVRKQFGFTVSVGVSFSKIFAKLGSDMKKPDATTEIPYQKFKQKTYSLPLNCIIGIGGRLAKKFEKININTIGDFVDLDEKYISQMIGKTGTELHQKLSGNLIDPVKCYFDITPPKSVGNGTTTITDIKSKEDVHAVISFLSEKIALRLSNGNFQGCCVSVSLKTADFKRFHHSHTTLPIRSKEEIEKSAMALVDSFWKYDQMLRSIRVQVSSLQKTDQYEQLSFFNTQTNNLTQSLKKIKDKYGNKIYIASDMASFINRKNSDEAPSGDK